MKKARLLARRFTALNKRKSSRGSVKSPGILPGKKVRSIVVANKNSKQANGYLCITPNIKVGNNVRFSRFINLYGCEVGDETKIDAYVEIQKNAKVDSRC